MGTIARMTAAELLKLYRRRALMAWSVALFVGAQLLYYGLGGSSTPPTRRTTAPAGGAHGLANAMMLVSYLGGVAAVMIGTAAGGGDTAAGVFRDLASTGRSRMALFAVRVPAALVVTWASWPRRSSHRAIGAVVFAGAGPAPVGGCAGPVRARGRRHYRRHDRAGGGLVVTAVLPQHHDRAAALLDPGPGPDHGTCHRLRLGT